MRPSSVLATNVCHKLWQAHMPAPIAGCHRGTLKRTGPALQIALVKSVGLDLGTTLVGSGIYNLYSGAAFGVPMPVQPMKSIAAVAITEADFGLNETLLAGVLVSGFVLTLAAARLIPGARAPAPHPWPTHSIMHWPARCSGGSRRPQAAVRSA